MAIEPSPSEGTASRGVRTPMRRAVSATFSGPTSTVSCANTELSDRIVAFSIVVQPEYEWSYVETSQAGTFGSGW